MVQQHIQEDKEFNATRDFGHITDPYFRDKLERGLIRYAPEDWTEIEPIEENKLR